MEFKIDENLPEQAAAVLSLAGHDATTVKEQELAGASDRHLASLCRHEKRAFVTLDLDFADIRVFPPTEYPGLIVLRLRRQDTPYVLKVVRRLIGTLASESVDGRLWIVEEDRIRVRE